MKGLLNPFTTGNPFLGTKLLRFSIGRGSGTVKGLTPQNRRKYAIFFCLVHDNSRCVPRINSRPSDSSSAIKQVCFYVQTRFWVKKDIS